MKETRFKQINTNVYQMKHKYYKVFLLMLFLILNLLLMIASLNLASEAWITKIAYLSIFQLGINIIALNVLGEKVFSVSVIFLFLSWIFHFGNIIIIGFKFNPELTFEIVTALSEDTIKETMRFSFFVQSFVAFGMFFVRVFVKERSTALSIKIEEEENYLYLIRNLGIILVIIGIGPTFYIDIGKIILFFQTGYVSTFSLSQNGYLILLARLFKVGIFLLIIGYKNKPKIATTIFITILIYQLFIMISGNRGRSVVEIIGLLFLYTNIIRQIKFKNLFAYGSLFYLIITVLNALSMFRQKQSPSIGEFLRSLTESFQESPIIMMLYEFGGTILTVCYSIMYFSENNHVQYGANYILSFLTIFPNFMGVLESVHSNAIYISLYPESYRSFLGGSYIGELYFSFRNYGIPFALLIGIFISIFSRKIQQAINYKKYILLSVLIIILPDILWWIRGYFIEIVRYPIWISLVIFILFNFLKKKQGIKKFKAKVI